MRTNEWSTGATDLSSDNSLRFTEDDKFFCRLLSKDTSSFDDPSLRVYYGIASVAVPFRWESRPGTPKCVVPSDNLPPLTPPPSLSKPCKNARPLGKKASLDARSTIPFARALDMLLRRSMPIPRPHSFYSPSQSSSSSSSSSGYAAMLWRCGSSSRSMSSFASCGCCKDCSDDESPWEPPCACYRVVLLRRKKQKQKQ